MQMTMPITPVGKMIGANFPEIIERLILSKSNYLSLKFIGALSDE
jgi:hypothetical protein